MKYTELKSLEKHIREDTSSGFSPIYLLVVKDEYDRECLVKRLIGLISQKKGEVKHFYSDGLELGEIAAECNTFSLFSDKVFLVVHDVHLAKKELFDFFENYLQHPNTQISCFFLAETLPKHQKCLKILEKVGVILDIPPPKPWEKEAALEKWIMHHASLRHKQIQPKASYLLMQHIGEDKRVLDMELEKCAAYVGDRDVITVEDISAVCTHLNLQTLWELGDATLQRRTADALRILESLFQQGEVPLALVAQMRHQIQTGFKICALFEKSQDPEEVSKAFPYLKGKRLQAQIQAAIKYGGDRFKKALIALFHAENELKGSQNDPKLICERLFVSIAQ